MLKDLMRCGIYTAPTDTDITGYDETVDELETEEEVPEKKEDTKPPRYLTEDDLDAVLDRFAARTAPKKEEPVEEDPDPQDWAAMAKKDREEQLEAAARAGGLTALAAIRPILEEKFIGVITEGYEGDEKVMEGIKKRVAKIDPAALNHYMSDPETVENFKLIARGLAEGKRKVTAPSSSSAGNLSRATASQNERATEMFNTWKHVGMTMEQARQHVKEHE